LIPPRVREAILEAMVWSLLATLFWLMLAAGLVAVAVLTLVSWSQDVLLPVLMMNGLH
jgi:hypothetical protein